MTQPTEGRCDLCGQQRPLFPRPFKDGTQPETAQLCARDYSRASGWKSDRLAEEIFFAMDGAS